jgi:predicted component of type VI protein secretion system
MPTVLITGEDGVQRRAAFPDRSLRIGRAPENDVVLADPNKGVSRAHAELQFENGHYVIVDLRSQNGTWVNGERVERAAVPANAEIAIGLYRLRLQASNPTHAAVVPKVAPALNVGDIPLYRPERAIGLNSLAGGGPVPEDIAPPRAGVSKWILFGGGVAIGVAVILVGRIMSPPPASPASTTNPAATSPAAAPIPPPAAASSAAAPAPPPAGTSPAGQAQAPAVPAEPPPKPAETAPAASTPPVNEPERPTRPAVSPAARATAREAFNAGSTLDEAGDWMGALRKYQEARQADATLPGLDRAVKGVSARLRTAGGDALARARQYDAIGQSADALKEYEKAAQWLPTDDPNRQIARSRADQLRNGGR